MLASCEEIFMCQSARRSTTSYRSLVTEDASKSVSRERTQKTHKKPSILYVLCVLAPWRLCAKKKIQELTQRREGAKTQRRNSSARPGKCTCSHPVSTGNDLVRSTFPPICWIKLPRSSRACWAIAVQRGKELFSTLASFPRWLGNSQ